MLYNLINKNTGQIDHANITALGLAEIGSKINMTLFRLEEVKDSQLKEKQLHELSDKERDKLLKEFTSTLSHSQLNDISCNIKRIEWKQNIGFYLRILVDRNAQTEIHVSIEQQKTKRKEQIELQIKRAIVQLESNIFSIVLQNHDISLGEFTEIFTNYTKSYDKV